MKETRQFAVFHCVMSRDGQSDNIIVTNNSGRPLIIWGLGQRKLRAKYGGGAAVLKN